MKIKAGKISNLTDARYFAAVGVEHIGFNFTEENKEQLTVEDAIAIKDWLSVPNYILEFDKIDSDQMFEYTEKLKTKNIQLPIEIINNDLSEYNIFAETDDQYVLKNKSEILQNPVLKKDQIIIAVFEVNNFEILYKDLPDAIYRFNISVEEQKKIISKYPDTNLELLGEAEEKIGIRSYEETNDLLDWIMDFKES